MFGNMKHRRLRQLVALVLGIVFALGTSASVVSATSMTMKMALGCDSGAMANNNCDGCGDKGCGMTATDCAATVCSPMVATAPQTPSTSYWGPQRRLSLAKWPALVGWPLPPDPHPPRTRDLA